MITSLVSSGGVALMALTVLALELVVLIVMARGGRPTGDMIANALSGMFLIMALGSALKELSPIAVAAFLALAFLAHVAGLAARLRMPRG